MHYQIHCLLTADASNREKWLIGLPRDPSLEDYINCVNCKVNENTNINIFTYKIRSGEVVDIYFYKDDDISNRYLRYDCAVILVNLEEEAAALEAVHRSINNIGKTVPLLVIATTPQVDQLSKSSNNLISSIINSNQGSLPSNVLIYIDARNETDGSISGLIWLTDYCINKRRKLKYIHYSTIKTVLDEYKDELVATLTGPTLEKALVSCMLLEATKTLMSVEDTPEGKAKLFLHNYGCMDPSQQWADLKAVIEEVNNDLISRMEFEVCVHEYHFEADKKIDARLQKSIESCSVRIIVEIVSKFEYGDLFIMILLNNLSFLKNYNIRLKRNRHHLTKMMIIALKMMGEATITEWAAIEAFFVQYNIAHMLGYLKRVDMLHQVKTHFQAQQDPRLIKTCLLHYYYNLKGEKWLFVFGKPYSNEQRYERLLYILGSAEEEWNLFMEQQGQWQQGKD
jgi:hypothetical protein